MKQDYDWLQSVDSQSLNASLLHMESAYKNFFRGGGFPKFKSRRNKQSFQSPCNKREIDFEKGLLSIPKLKNIPIVISREFKGKIKTITITRGASGKHFASILVDTQQDAPQKKPIQNVVGMDLGVKFFAALSDDTYIENPRFLEQEIERLKHLQKQASRKVKGSQNHKKSLKKVAIQHEKIANERKDFLHKNSTLIVKKFDTIIVEDLATANLTKRCKPKQDEAGKYLPNNQSQKRGLNKSILDAGWATFVEMLKYKCEFYGCNFVKVDRFFASSKTCSNCGRKNENLTLKDREWDCEDCGHHHERDNNASKTIKQEGIRLLRNKKSGRGTSKEPVESRRLRRARKQEKIFIQSK